jgi:hypothetical protein
VLVEEEVCDVQEGEDTLGEQVSRRKYHGPPYPKFRLSLLHLPRQSQYEKNSACFDSFERERESNTTTTPLLLQYFVTLVLFYC